jgi:hypothetical protein
MAQVIEPLPLILKPSTAKQIHKKKKMQTVL